MTKLVANLAQTLHARSLPTVVKWNRLEARPRTIDFDRALKAEVRDALWMLTRQWQIGEFTGCDAGSPIGAKINYSTTHLDSYAAAGSPTEAYDDTTPLQTHVEQRAIAWVRAGKKLQIDLRLQLGRQWGKLLTAAGAAGYATAYRALFPFALPPRDRENADVFAHVQAWQTLAAVAGRATDGGELYLAIKGGMPASHGVVLVAPADQAKLDALGQHLIAWFDDLYAQPVATGAWQSSKLDYSFTCSAPEPNARKTLVADEFPGGDLDWWAFDVAAPGPVRAIPRKIEVAAPAVAFAAAPATKVAAAAVVQMGPRILEVAQRPDRAVPRVQVPGTTRAFLPTQLTFAGAPNARWWRFEDSKVSFGDVSPSTTDIGKLLLVEFALVYANDWYMFPLTLPAGSLANVNGLMVTNTFGERLWVDAAGAGAANAWQHWRMYTLTARGESLADMTMFLAPAIPKVQEGEPLDEVVLARDENANLVWAVETTVPLITGESIDGTQAARETAAYHQSLVGAAPPGAPYAAPIYYQAMTSVPENWIPMPPAHAPNSQRQIQLQRGGMLRLIPGDPVLPVKIEPATPSLRPGLDVTPKQTYFIDEEQIPRGGTIVTRAFQRTRWRNGRTFVWLGMGTQTGRGNADSHLTFDSITQSP